MWWPLLDNLKATLGSLLNLLLRGSSGTSLVFTGVLGLAVCTLLYRLAASSGRKANDRSQQQPYDPAQPSTSAAAAAHATLQAHQRAAPDAAATPAAAVARRLAGVRRATLSVPGVLLEEAGAEQLEESASVRDGVAALVREVARATYDLYLLCHVSDDIGEALVRGALEHAGVTGAAPGQVPPHRLLFCGTLAGKVSMVRQLDPELHVDAHPQTVSDLQRFVKQLVLVDGGSGQTAAAASGSAAGLAAPNVQRAPSLAAALGLSS